jgi:4-hydroxybenzoate polyprenyltransferase
MAAPPTTLPEPTVPGRRSLPGALLAAMRPRQWAKNLVLLAPLVFALRATDLASAERALLAFLAFCLLASATYLANDLVDRERDRSHPEKRHRPIASGELPAAPAVWAALVLGGLGLALSSVLGFPFLACAVGYLLLQALYSGLLKRAPVLDVFAIAGGFVLRVVAGAEAIGVPISNWLYLCTLLLALFLAIEKRRAELVLLADGAGRHRGILARYDLPLLDQFVAIVSGATVLSYALYTLAPDTIAKFGTDRLKYTIPLVLFGIFRYLYLVHRYGEGGQPERVLFRDRATQLNILAYVAVVAWAIYTRAP